MGVSEYKYMYVRICIDFTYVLRTSSSPSTQPVLDVIDNVRILTLS